MTDAELLEREAVVDELVHVLADDAPRHSRAWWHYLYVVTHLGADGARALLQEVAAVEAAGGMQRSTRKKKFVGGRRTAGGVFFALARARIGHKLWQKLDLATRPGRSTWYVEAFVRLLVLARPAKPVPAKPGKGTKPAKAPKPAAPAPPARANAAPGTPSAKRPPAPAPAPAKAPGKPGLGTARRPSTPDVVIVRKR